VTSASFGCLEYRLSFSQASFHHHRAGVHQPRSIEVYRTLPERFALREMWGKNGAFRVLLSYRRMA
jgi:hypothetical protein